MTRSYDIAEFNLADGVTPRVADKLNLNFRRLIAMMVDEGAGDGHSITEFDLPLSTESGGTGRVGFPENALVIGNGQGPLSYLETEKGFLYADDDGEPAYWNDVSFDHSEVTNAILYGRVDSTSTNKVFTASVDGLDRLVDGTCVMLHNGVVTSASGFTININGLGAKKCYNNMTLGTAETTLFNVNYTMLFVYDSTLDSGNGGWWLYRGYNSNTDTIGYQLRGNNGTLPAADKFYRYRILFTSADGSHWVPSTTSTSTNATALRDVNQRPINPFGPIVYWGGSGAVEANANVSSANLWQQYQITFGYAFNRTGAALDLNFPAPVYIKCAPQQDGSAIIDADTPYVQALPNSADGKIYIFLGMAYSATAIELRMEHPIYYYSDGAIRQWTNPAPAPAPGTTDYNDLINKPSIEDVELVGDKTFPELGIFIDPEEQYPQSDDYALTNIEITDLWNAVIA